MKIRNGFVSNSSSSSFMIYGTTLERSDFEKNLESLKKKAIEVLSKSDKSYDVKELEEWYGVPDNPTDEERENVIDQFDGPSEIMYSLFDRADNDDLESHSYPYDDAIFVGICPSRILDEETGREFKDRVERQIREVFPDVQGFNFYQECWFDG